MGCRAFSTLLALFALAALPACGRGRADSGAVSPRAELRVTSKPVEDVFLLTGELRAVRSVSLVTPRSEGELQIRWMAEDGAEVKEGERVAEFDPTRLDPDDRGAAAAAASGGDRPREPRALGRRGGASGSASRSTRRRSRTEKARLDAAVPLELRPAVERTQVRRRSGRSRRRPLEKARLDRDAYDVTARAEIATARAGGGQGAARGGGGGEGARQHVARRAAAPASSSSGTSGSGDPTGRASCSRGTPCGRATRSARSPTRRRWRSRPPSPSRTTGASRPGMKARCILDTYPDRVFAGRVEEVGSVAAEAAGTAGSPRRAGFAVRVVARANGPADAARALGAGRGRAGASGRRRSRAPRRRALREGRPGGAPGRLGGAKVQLRVPARRSSAWSSRDSRRATVSRSSELLRARLRRPPRRAWLRGRARLRRTGPPGASGSSRPAEVGTPLPVKQAATSSSPSRSRASSSPCAPRRSACRRWPRWTSRSRSSPPRAASVKKGTSRSCASTRRCSSGSSPRSGPSSTRRTKKVEQKEIDLGMKRLDLEQQARPGHGRPRTKARAQGRRAAGGRAADRAREGAQLDKTGRERELENLAAEGRVTDAIAGSELRSLRQQRDRAAGPRAGARGRDRER